MNRIQLAAIVLAVFSQVAMADVPSCGQPCPVGGFSGGLGLPERVLHFPPVQSVGEIVLVDGSCVIPEVSREFHPGYVFAPPGQRLGPARGDVRIPAGQCVSLHLGGPGVTRQQCFDVLKSLAPNDVQDLDFMAPLRVDDAFLPYVARLTGVTHFCLVTARFSGRGWATLQCLTHLEHICTPYGLTDSEVAGIATLRTVNEMEMVATRMTNAGLASIATMQNLQVLHLECTAAVTDEGLKALATLPKLRHLRLSGQFTDRGLAHLAAAPSLKAMWLETPRATEEGLHSLSRIQSLERLCVPWLDRITEQSVSHLRSMPRLKALGVGDARSANAGMASLATLTNLEVLAIKGGPGLTDGGLKPLAGMPKLRALEIYHSRITEQGLAHLSLCKQLDSIQIRSSIAISRQAVARLRAELPNVRTLDISQPESPKGPKSLAMRQP